MTPNPDPLSRPCPRCHADRGQRCKNYLGQNKATCGERLKPPACRKCKAEHGAVGYRDPDDDFWSLPKERPEWMAPEDANRTPGEIIDIIHRGRFLKAVVVCIRVKDGRCQHCVEKVKPAEQPSLFGE